jgi:hypothetical protein
MESVDTRSYFPEFSRTIALPDGVSYSVRELQDLQIGEMQRIIEDEKSFIAMKEEKFFERHAIERQHLRSLLVLPVSNRCSTPKGENVLRLEGDGYLDLREGDIVYVAGGPFVERNNVLSVTDDARAAVVAGAWLFGVPSGARVYRSVRPDAIDLLTYTQFARVISEAKTPPKEATTENPQPAASEPTS